MRLAILGLLLALGCGDYSSGRYLYRVFDQTPTGAVRLGEMTSDAVCAEIADALERSPSLDNNSRYECRSVDE